MKPKPLASLNHFTVPLLTCGVSFQDLLARASALQFGPHTQTAARFPRLRRTSERPTETTRTMSSIGRNRPAVKGGDILSDKWALSVQKPYCFAGIAGKRTVTSVHA